MPFDKRDGGVRKLALAAVSAIGPAARELARVGSLALSLLPDVPLHEGVDGLEDQCRVEEPVAH